MTFIKRHILIPIMDFLAQIGCDQSEDIKS